MGCSTKSLRMLETDSRFVLDSPLSREHACTRMRRAYDIDRLRQAGNINDRVMQIVPLMVHLQNFVVQDDSQTERLQGDQ